MSEHRRKPPQSHGGGRAAARRGAGQPPSGRRAAPQRGANRSGAGPVGDTHSYGGRAEARRAAQRTGGGRRRAADGAAAEAGGRAAARRAMAREPQTKRFIDYPRAGKTGMRRWVPSWKLIAGSAFGFFALIIGAAGLALAFVVKVPDPSQAATSESNVYYWSDGSQMAATGGDVNRQIVPITSIPKSMQNAVISAENATFYEDSGVSPIGIARAVFNMARGGDTQSGSTITQQYVKNAMLSQEQTLTRKVKELFISIKADSDLTKDQILKGYLNTAYYGRGAYGIQAAAQAYYNKDCDDLTASESAFLSAVLNGPNFYDPAGGIGDNATKALNTQRAEERWAWTLGREVQVKRMSAAERSRILADGFPTPKDPKLAKGLSGQNGYLVETAQKYVVKQTNLSPDDLSKGGYQIHTTFDKKKTELLEKSVNASRKTYLDNKKRARDKFVQFGGASVDPNNGKIVALYGGEGYDENHFSNNADSSGVPVGSTWKPYVLAAAMKYGKYDSDGQGIPATSKYNGNDRLVIKDRNGDAIPGPDGQPFRQKNESERPWGYISLNKAMEQSVNAPFAQLGVDVGLGNVKQVAMDTGILEASMDKLNVSYSLGTSTPSAIRMADSYGTFATSGKHIEPYSVTKVEKEGQELEGFDAPKPKQALENNIANNVTKVLENVIENGTAQKAKALGRSAAGKTGTTDENKSAWFVGYTKQLSTSVAMFRNDPESKKLLSMNGTGGFDSIHGGAIPTEIWTDYMKAALKGKENLPFPEPEPIGPAVDQAGAPSPTPTPSDTPTASPSEEPTESPSGTPSTSPSPSDSCSVFDPACQPNGGNNNNGGNGNNGGNDGGPSGTPTPPSGGNDSGGIFGGPTGTRRE
ncbi:transglycosylase domain-containing protein [Streptomyces sp. NPDC048639]|uniref:transglycosylase domain-containing protein n=1 Tax=Streptomyces sp. NPDC048639 TaxID=3365581 RepID=UPI003720799A